MKNITSPFGKITANLTKKEKKYEKFKNNKHDRKQFWKKIERIKSRTIYERRKNKGRNRYLAIAVEHKGRSYVVEHINIYDNEEDPRAPYNSYYNEYYQLYINGRRASGASSFDWFEYNMSNDYQIVPKKVQEVLIKNIRGEEIKIVKYYQNQD